MPSGRILLFSAFFGLAGCGESTEFGGSGATEKARQSADGKEQADDPTAPTDGKKPSVRDPLTLSQEFVTADRVPMSVAYEPETHSIAQNLTMARRVEPRQENVAQIDRPRGIKLLKQGTPGQAKSESFTQAQSGLLDIQIVIDDSGSMKEEQTNLATKLSALLTSIADRNWRINVVTTDPGGTTLPAKICSRAIINRGDTNAETAFKNAVNAGLAGSGNERGILMAVEGLKCATTPWVRNGSKIAVLIVSDEDNCSDGAGCGTDPWGKPEYLTSFLKDTLKRPLGTDARIYGIYRAPGTTCSTAAVANQYDAAVKATNGTYGSICDADYTATLKKISSDVAAILKSDYQLAAAPDAGSTKVYVGGVLQTSGYKIEGRVLTFTTPPPEAAMIKVDYVVGAAPILTRFPLGELPAPGTLTVLVNGVEAAASAYSLDAATKDLVFAAAPEHDAEVKATYRTGDALPKAFDLAVEPKAGTLKVKLDGKDTNEYALAGKRVTFAKAPADGASLEFRYEVITDGILAYTVLAADVEVADFSVADAASLAPVATTLDEGVLTFPAGEFQDGRALVFTYRSPDDFKGEITLPSPPLAGTLSVKGSACAADKFVLSGTKLAYDCDLAGVSNLAISFESSMPTQQVFTLAAFRPGLIGRWHVEVDGVATTEFSAVQGTVILATAPPGGAKVKLTFLED